MGKDVLWKCEDLLTLRVVVVISAAGRSGGGCGGGCGVCGVKEDWSEHVVVGKNY